MGNADRGSEGRKGFQADREVAIGGFRLQFSLSRERPPALPQQQSSIRRQRYGESHGFQPQFGHGRDPHAFARGTPRFCRWPGTAQEEEEEIFGVQKHEPRRHPAESGRARHCGVHGQEQQEGNFNDSLSKPNASAISFVFGVRLPTFISPSPTSFKRIFVEGIPGAPEGFQRADARPGGHPAHAEARANPIATGFRRASHGRAPADDDPVHDGRERDERRTSPHHLHGVVFQGTAALQLLLEQPGHRLVADPGRRVQEQRAERQQQTSGRDTAQRAQRPRGVVVIVTATVASHFLSFLYYAFHVKYYVIISSLYVLKMAFRGTSNTYVVCF